MKILIVEDDKVSQRILFKILSDYGKCDLVNDGVEAIDAYLMAFDDNELYDLISLDIMMPKIDGVEILSKIRDFEKKNKIKENKKAKIIMVSALAETNFVKLAFENGCDSYISKPIDIDKLIENLKQLEVIK
ncbi:response regulator [Clostridiaceae bacterium HSG29]|nr:response regulator [Clostridiaceae bacterium HSG29]